MNTNTNTNAAPLSLLEKRVRAHGYGSTSRLARALGLTPWAVHRAFSNGIYTDKKREKYLNAYNIAFEENLSIDELFEAETNTKNT